MYSRSLMNYSSPPPGYSGNAIGTGVGRAEARDNICPCKNHPRRPVFDESEYSGKAAKASAEAKDSAEKSDKTEEKNISDEIILAGILILLFSEENADSIMLFALCFLLFC